MALRRNLTRSLVTISALGGLGAAFVAGTTYAGGAGVAEPWPSGPGGGSRSDASPAAYTGSDLSLPESCDELLRWYVERGVDRVGPYGWDYYGGPYYFAAEDAAGGLEGAVTAAEAPNQSAAAPAPAPVRSTNGETGTNVQEAGVDEPDVVKTDGKTLFRVQGGDLVTYDLTGAQVQRLASVDLPGSAASGSTEILLSGETVVAIVSDVGGADGRSTTEVVTIDVADPAAPTVAHTVEYDTALVTARMHDGVVRLVLKAALPDLDFVHPDRRTTDWEATRANQDLVRATTVEDWLPTATIDDGDADPLVDCDQVAIPDDGTSLGTIVVVGFDAPAPDSPSVSGLAVDTDLAYASADQLYLATNPTVDSIVACADCCMDCPVGQPGDGPPGWDERIFPGWIPRLGADVDGTSHLYAFDLDGIDTTFAASGEVDGVIRDRWSMDAAEGVLRVAVGPNFGTGDFNSVVTFRQEGNDLVEAGRLDDLGIGEQIESVRWFDTLAIVVTFRQVDPLYAIDLTDPKSPRLMGKLKIPGYSAYLHPLGESRLLGLGQGPGKNGIWGAQAGLFNVTDLTHPTQLDVVSYGPGTEALATYDPRQLTWLPDGRTVLSVVADYGKRGNVAYVSVLTLGDGDLANRMVEVEYGDEASAVRLVPLADGRVVLVTGDDASFFDL